MKAIRRLADMYRDGIGLAADPLLAEQYYQQAIAQGDVAAGVALGGAYLTGKAGAPGSQAQGAALLEVAAAERQAGAAVMLANSYLRGTGVPQDAARGMALLETASAAGESDASRRLIQLHLEGLRDEVVADRTAARALLEKVAEQLPPEARTVERLMVDTAFANTLEQFAALQPLWSAVEGDRSGVAGRIRKLNANAYVFLMQTELQARELFEGTLSGQLDGATIRAFNRYCDAQGLVDDCRRGPLSSGAVRAFARSLGAV
ncbi:MAG: tetratricopeptide repeat protein [Cypionkella sp.]